MAPATLFTSRCIKCQHNSMCGHTCYTVVVKRWVIEGFQFEPFKEETEVHFFVPPGGDVKEVVHRWKAQGVRFTEGTLARIKSAPSNFYTRPMET